MTIEDKVWDMTDSFYPALKKVLAEYDEAVKNENEDEMLELANLRSKLCYQIAISEAFLEVCHNK